MISLRAFDSGMASKQKLDNSKIGNVESAIYFIRGQRVMLDSDLAVSAHSPYLWSDQKARKVANLPDWEAQ